MSEEDYGKVYKNAVARHMTGRIPQNGVQNLPNPLNPLNYQRTESEIRMEAKLDKIIALLEELKARG